MNHRLNMYLVNIPFQQILHCRNTYYLGKKILYIKIPHKNHLFLKHDLEIERKNSMNIFIPTVL